MPKRQDIDSILIIGAGPIIIGQACEFDYSGTQACKALKAEGYRIILVNSNPATIMTDPDLAHATYIEPITPKVVAKIIEKERAELELTTVNTIAESRAFIHPDHKNTLIVKEAFDRSWRRVGLALDRIGFTVEDRNRLEGIYFVRYIDPDADKKKAGDDDGLLSGIMFWRKDGDDNNSDSEKYLIQVRETGTSSSQVNVLDEDNAPVKSRAASRILNLLHEQLK